MSEPEPKPETESRSNEPRITFRYLKSNFFRVLKVDGAWAGLSPQGEIVLSVYNERVALPDQQDFDVSKDGTLKLAKQIGARGIVRELECVMSLRPEIALALSNLLRSHVEKFSEQTGVKYEADDMGRIVARMSEDS